MPAKPPERLDIPLSVARKALQSPSAISDLVDRLGDLSPQSIENLQPLVFDVLRLGPDFPAEDLLKRMLKKLPEWIRSEVTDAYNLLGAALAFNRFDLVDALVEIGVDPAYETSANFSALDLAATITADPQVQESLGNSLLRRGTCSSTQKDRALKNAAHSGNLGMVKSLLAHGAGFGTKFMDGTALTRVCDTVKKIHQTAIVQALLQAPGVDQVLDHGWGSLVSPSALHRAATEGTVQVVSMLLEAGASVNPPEDLSPRRCQTPLMAAAYGLKPEVIDLLIQSGAEAHAIDSFGRNAFHHLVFHVSSEDPHVQNRARIQIIESLMDAGADPRLKDNEGATPMDYAKRRGDPIIIEALTVLEEKASSRHLERDTPQPGAIRPPSARRL